MPIQKRTIIWTLALPPLVGILGLVHFLLFGHSIWALLLGMCGFAVFGAQNLYRKGLNPPATDEMSQLRNQFQKGQFIEGLEKPSARALDQLVRLQKLTSGFTHVINEKLNPGELTYTRYTGAFGEARAGIFSNLQNLAKTFEVLSGSTSPSTETKTKIETSLETNDRAVAELEKLALAVNEIQTSQPSLQLETNIKLLEDLAERAKKYSNPN